MDVGKWVILYFCGWCDFRVDEFFCFFVLLFLYVNRVYLCKVYVNVFRWCVRVFRCVCVRVCVYVYLVVCMCF